MEYLRIRNWAKYQGTAGLNTQYVKLYTRILTDPEFMELGDRERLCFLLLLTYAGINQNKIPADPITIMAMCWFDDPPDIEILMSKGLLETWSETAHNEMLDKRDSKLLYWREKKRQQRMSKKCPSNVHSGDIDIDIDIDKKNIPRKRGRSPKTCLPENFSISSKVRQWAETKGFNNLEAHFESFVEKAESNGYMYASWDAALKRAIREDWAGLKKSKLAPKTENDWESRGRELGIQANPGESWESYIARIRRESERTVQ